MRSAVQALPLAIVFALVAFMVERDGGFAVTVWYPIGLVVLAVAVTLAALGPGGSSPACRGSRSRRSPASPRSPLWGFATIALGRGPGRRLGRLEPDAALPARLRAARRLACRRAGRSGRCSSALSASSRIEGVVTVEQVVHAGDPSQFLIGSRLSEPLGYPNATGGALHDHGLADASGLASRPWLPAPARGLAFGLAGLNATLNLLTESRGSVFTLPGVVIAFLVLVPGRLRSLAALRLVGGRRSRRWSRPCSHVYGGDPAQFTPAIRHAL